MMSEKRKEEVRRLTDATIEPSAAVYRSALRDVLAELDETRSSMHAAEARLAYALGRWTCSALAANECGECHAKVGAPHADECVDARLLDALTEWLNWTGRRGP